MSALAIVTACIALTAAACGGSSSDGEPAGAGTGSDADPAIAELVPASIADAGVLKIGTAVYPPAVILDPGGKAPTGWNISSIKEVASLMGLEPEFNIIPFDGLVPRLEAGRFDVAVGEMAMLPERTERLTFVQDHESGIAFIVEKGSTLGPFATVEDVCGLKLSVLLGSSELKSATEYDEECQAKGLEPVTYSTYKDQPTANLAVTEGRVDASLSSASQAAYVADQSDGALEVVPNEFAELLPTGIAIAKTDYSDEMAKAVAAAMQQVIDSGRHTEILDEFNGGLGGITTAAIVPEPTS